MPSCSCPVSRALMGAAGGRSGTTGMGALQFVDQLVDRRSCIVQCGHREITDRVGDHDAAYSTAASSTSESRTGLPRMLLEPGHRFAWPTPPTGCATCGWCSCSPRAATTPRGLEANPKRALRGIRSPCTWRSPGPSVHVTCLTALIVHRSLTSFVPRPRSTWPGSGRMAAGPAGSCLASRPAHCPTGLTAAVRESSGGHDRLA